MLGATSLCLAVASLVATTVRAAPAPTPAAALADEPQRRQCFPTLVSTTLTANFDDLPYTEGSANPIPTPYKGLEYVHFQNEKSDGFIKPATPPEDAILFGVPGAIIAYDYIALDLHSLYYSCDQGIPQPACDVKVVGTKAVVPLPGQNNTVTKVLMYPAQKPGPAGSYVQLRASFDDGWSDLGLLNFSATVAGTSKRFNGGLQLDSIVYVGKKLTCV